MQYVPIKKELKNGKDVYIVNAISLKNSAKSVVQKIPHPLGTDYLEYETLDMAKDAIARAGFSYVLPDGKKGYKKSEPAPKINDKDYKSLIYATILDKINSSNSMVSAAAITSLCEFPTEQTFEILFDKIGEENEIIRKNAICGICRYAQILQDKIIKSLEHSNWVTRNSAITCIKSLADENDINLESFIAPLVNTCNDSNPIVQANALSTIGLVYQNFCKKN